MGAPRSDRVAGLLRRELAEILHSQFEHELAGSFISLTDVEVSRDLSHAKVHVAVLQAEQAADILAFLNEQAGVVRHELGQRVRMRSTPVLKFLHDRSSQTGARIDALLDAARKK